MSRRPQDAKLFVKFTTREVLNEAKSYGATILGNNNEVVEKIEGAGKPVHDNVDYINITIPGDRENIVDRPVACCDKKLLDKGVKLTPMLACRARKGFDERPMLEECDVHRFIDEFTAFRAGQEEQTTGTDLKLWPGIDRASAADLAFHHIYTVEQLAELNDSLTGPRFLGLRTRARDYLERATKDAAAMNAKAQQEAVEKALETEREARRALEKQVAELMAQQSAKPAAGKEKR
jgi:hypothetical protein